MAQKSAGMTFLNCCTMTLSYCYDNLSRSIGKIRRIW